MKQQKFFSHENEQAGDVELAAIVVEEIKNLHCDSELAEEYGEDHEEAPGGFQLRGKDFVAIGAAKDVIQLFLSERHLSAAQVVGLGHALYALERLPDVTPGIYCDYGIFYHIGNEECGERRYISFLITEEAFEIGTGGSVYGPRRAGDECVAGPGWKIRIGGFSVDQSLGEELPELENRVRGHLDFGAEIQVADTSTEIAMELDEYY